MTYKEALQRVDNEIARSQSIVNANDNAIEVKLHESKLDYLLTIKKAIEKQIPMPMIDKKYLDYDGEEDHYEVCANCRTQVRFAGTMTARYCFMCGQAIRSGKKE